MGTTLMAPVHSNCQIMLVRSYKDSSFCEVTCLSTVLLGSWLCPLGASFWSLSSITTSEVGIEEYAPLRLLNYLLLLSSLCR